MGEADESCILQQFQQLADLDEYEKDLLRELEKHPRAFGAGELLAEAGQPSDHFYTITKGWACAERVLADGRRQILDLFMPGQILGLREISFRRNLSDFRAIDEVEACPFPRKRLTDIFDRAPRLGDLFFLILAREQSMLVERVINIGRRTAAERLAHFLIEIKVRLNQESNDLKLPMTQVGVGDALSLSAVHVSRTYHQLSDLGLIDKSDGCIRICDLDALIEYGGFDRAYLESSSDWARQRRPAPV